MRKATVYDPKYWYGRMIRKWNHYVSGRAGVTVRRQETSHTGEWCLRLQGLRWMAVHGEACLGEARRDPGSLAWVLSLIKDFKPHLTVVLGSSAWRGNKKADLCSNQSDQITEDWYCLTGTSLPPGVKLGALRRATVKSPTSQADGAQSLHKTDLKTKSDLDIPCVSEFMNWDLYQLHKSRVTTHKVHYAAHHMSYRMSNFILIILWRASWWRRKRRGGKAGLKLNIQKADHGIQLLHFMAKRRGKVEAVIDFLGLQNHCGWWLQPWN